MIFSIIITDFLYFLLLIATIIDRFGVFVDRHSKKKIITLGELGRGEEYAGIIIFIVSILLKLNKKFFNEEDNFSNIQTATLALTKEEAEYFNNFINEFIEKHKVSENTNKNKESYHFFI